MTLLIIQAQQKFEYVGMRLSHDMARSTVPSLQTVGGTWLVRYSTVVHTPHSRRELGRFPYNGEPRATHDSSLSADVIRSKYLATGFASLQIVARSSSNVAQMSLAGTKASAVIFWQSRANSSLDMYLLRSPRETTWR